MPDPLVLSHYQATPLLRARDAARSTAATTPDLGLTTVEVALTPAGAQFPTGEQVPWETLERIRDSPTRCFLVASGEARPIQAFSERTGWLRSLMPTPLAPTVLVSGIAMHRIKDTDPYHDTLRKIAALAPVVGHVLDTATGLGYTAIEAARTARQVITVELDPAALEVARLNPWSRALFENPLIHQVIGDVAEVVESFEDAAFARVIHDPPMLSLAGELYSTTFYRQLCRVLQPRGRLFHYIGDPASQSGRRTTGGVLRRLQEAGFARVVRCPEAFGVVAYK